mgnify:CR=1 FL=1
MIHFGKPILDKSERNNLTKVLKSGILTHGPEAEMKPLRSAER